MKNKKYLYVLVPVLILLLIFVFIKRSLLVLGGALVSIGILIQGFGVNYDFSLKEDPISPSQVLEEVSLQNNLSSFMKSVFPEPHNNPLIVIILCMDYRINTEELFGDTRHFYYIIRTAGSVIRKKEMEMIELAVIEKNAKLVIFTEHTDCSAEHIAADEIKSKQYPSITKAIQDRNHEIESFLNLSSISSRITSNKLLVKKAIIDTKTAKLTFLNETDGTQNKEK